jgi:hypothetical protein
MTERSDSQRPSSPPPSPPLDPDALPAVAIHPSVGPEWPASGLGPIHVLLEGLPDPGSVGKGAWIAVFPGPPAPRRKGIVSRLFTPRTMEHVHLAVRCTALLARGYVRVCADEQGTAFGQAP